MAVTLRMFLRCSPAGMLLVEIILANAKKRRGKECIVFARQFE
jgi:hypothetical protein